MALVLRFITFSGSKKKEPWYACLSEAEASHSHRTWTEVSSSVAHSLQVGLLLNPITYGCLLRVLCLVRRPVMTLDCVLLKDSNQVLLAGLGPKINFRPCLWVLQGPCRITKRWLSTQHLILLLIFHLEIPRDGTGPINFWVEPPLVSLSVISFPCTPACPGTQYSPTVYRLQIYIIQCLSALLYQWRCCFGSLKCFQSRLAIRANTDIYLWSTLNFNFINAG